MLENSTLLASNPYALLPVEPISGVQPQAAPQNAAEKIEELAILWFPDTCSIELQIGETAYSPFFRSLSKTGMAEHRADDKEGGRDPFFRFAIHADAGKIKKLQSRLNNKNPQVPFDYCSGATARLINSYANIHIPFFKGRSPSILGHYLADLSRDKTQNLVYKVEYFGEEPDVAKQRLFDAQDRMSELFWETLAGGMLCCKVGASLCDRFRKPPHPNH